eukprot:4027487-Alexandrium_andersonii.AAC.1
MCIRDSHCLGSRGRRHEPTRTSEATATRRGATARGSSRLHCPPGTARRGASPCAASPCGCGC